MMMPMISNDEIGYWERARAICCQQWGKAPWEFDEAWEAGLLTLTAINRSVQLAVHSAPDPVLVEEYLYPGTLEAAREAAEEKKLASSWDHLMALKGKKDVG